MKKGGPTLKVNFLEILLAHILWLNLFNEICTYNFCSVIEVSTMISSYYNTLISETLSVIVTQTVIQKIPYILPLFTSFWIPIGLWSHDSMQICVRTASVIPPIGKRRLGEGSGSWMLKHLLLQLGNVPQVLWNWHSFIFGIIL